MHRLRRERQVLNIEHVEVGRGTGGLTSSYLYYHDVFEQDPAAAGPWTGADVAAMEIGVETVT